MGIKYKRVLLKLSGEALAGKKKVGLDYDIIGDICDVIKECYDLGVEFGIVIGGGNFWRGRSSGDGMDRVRADQIGMLATVMNSLAVADVLEQKGVVTRVATAVSIQTVAETYIRNRVIRHFEKGRAVIMAGGTGSPFFSTDSAAALRATEIKAEIFLKATMVDGVYNKDPKKFNDAVRYEKLTYGEILEQRLNVIDSTAATMCNDNNMKLLVFDLSQPENIKKAILGENIGTLVSVSG
ncbi:uridylate kinase [Clostridia bacterium]|nr:uridylate kinase [Clostridia bacterium]